MHAAEDLLKEGDLTGALGTLQEQVRNDPADAKGRIFLFQLLAVAGQWDRALTQLNVAGDLDGKTLPMVQAYREALRCEAYRERIYAGVSQPLVIGDPSEWIALALESLKLAGQGKYVEAGRLRDEAYEDAPVTPGRINDEPFEWIADADSRIGPFVEAIVNGGLYWIPFQRLARIELEPPIDLRDLVWMPAQFTWANGGEAVGFIPSRYPGTPDSGDHACLLCRRTEWREAGGETFCGLGQRMYCTDQGEYPLLDIRSIEIQQEAGAGGEDAGLNPTPAGPA